MCTRDLNHVRWLMEQFQLAEPDDQGLLQDSEVISLMRNINNTITTAVICQKLKVTAISWYCFWYCYGGRGWEEWGVLLLCFVIVLKEEHQHYHCPIIGQKLRVTAVCCCHVVALSYAMLAEGEKVEGGGAVCWCCCETGVNVIVLKEEHQLHCHECCLSDVEGDCCSTSLSPLWFVRCGSWQLFNFIVTSVVLSDVKGDCCSTSSSPVLFVRCGRWQLFNFIVISVILWVSFVRCGRWLLFSFIVISVVLSVSFIRCGRWLLFNFIVISVVCQMWKMTAFQLHRHQCRLSDVEDDCFSASSSSVSFCQCRLSDVEDDCFSTSSSSVSFVRCGRWLLLTSLSSVSFVRCGRWLLFSFIITSVVCQMWKMTAFQLHHQQCRLSDVEGDCCSTSSSPVLFVRCGRWLLFSFIITSVVCQMWKVTSWFLRLPWCSGE